MVPDVLLLLRPIDVHIGVNISEQKSGTERMKKRKKRELVFFTPPGAQLVLLCTAFQTLNGFCPSYDNPGYRYPGPYTARTKGPFTLVGIPAGYRAARYFIPPAVAFTSGVNLAGNGERYANELTALSRCRHRQWRDNSKTKALIGQVHDTARDPAGISLWKRSSAVPLGCHAEINKSALIGLV